MTETARIRLTTIEPEPINPPVALSRISFFRRERGSSPVKKRGSAAPEIMDLTRMSKSKASSEAIDVKRRNNSCEPPEERPEVTFSRLKSAVVGLEDHPTIGNSQLSAKSGGMYM